MSTYNTEVISPTKDKANDEESSLDERLIACDNEELVYVRRASQKDSRRVIGKDNLNFDNSHLSKEHACFQYRNERLYVKDCRSTFGTTINQRFLVANKWHALSSSDTVGFIVSKPSTWIAKIVKKFPDNDDIALEEFSNPPIGLKLCFNYLDGKLKFNVVRDVEEHEFLQKNAPIDSFNNADSYYYDNCLEMGKKHSKNCSCAERSCTEGHEDEFDSVVGDREPQLETKLENTDSQNDSITHMDISLLDCKGAEDNGKFTVPESNVDTLSTHEIEGVKSEDGDSTSCSFGHFTSELISGSEIVSESDSLSGFSSSESDSSSSPCSSSSSNSSSGSAISESNDSEIELDTSIVIENIDCDENCQGYDNDWGCQKVCSFTNSDTQNTVIYGLPDACVPGLDRTEEYLSEWNNSVSCSDENKKKRSFDKYNDDSQSSDEEGKPKKAKLSPIGNKFTFKTFAKEVVKGALYTLATITALGIYGSTIDNQE